MRTQVSGINGLFPEFVVPGVLSDPGPKSILITYQQPDLSILLDKPKTDFRFELSPELLFFRYALPVDVWRLRPSSRRVDFFKILYRGLALFPLGLLLRQFANQTAVILIGVIVPPLFLELILRTGHSSGAPLVDKLVIDMMIIIVGYLVARRMGLQTEPAPSQ
jgi:hypothetical protein